MELVLSRLDLQDFRARSRDFLRFRESYVELYAGFLVFFRRFVHFALLQRIFASFIAKFRINYNIFLKKPRKIQEISLFLKKPRKIQENLAKSPEGQGNRRSFGIITTHSRA